MNVRNNKNSLVEIKPSFQEYPTVMIPSACCRKPALQSLKSQSEPTYGSWTASQHLIPHFFSIAHEQLNGRLPLYLGFTLPKINKKFSSRTILFLEQTNSLILVEIVFKNIISFPNWTILDLTKFFPLNHADKFAPLFYFLDLPPRRFFGRQTLEVVKSFNQQKDFTSQDGLHVLSWIKMSMKCLCF